MGQRADCYRLNRIPPESYVEVPMLSKPQNVTVFGHRAFTEVIELKVVTMDSNRI